MEKKEKRVPLPILPGSPPGERKYVVLSIAKVPVDVQTVMAEEVGMDLDHLPDMGAVIRVSFKFKGTSTTRYTYTWIIDQSVDELQEEAAADFEESECHEAIDALDNPNSRYLKLAGRHYYEVGTES